MRNEHAKKRWSFLDGPITANNPMGVHHAWGRTYKDLYQRFHTMRGHEQRYQNGFDCQGLWVEVEVEKELGFTVQARHRGRTASRASSRSARSACCASPTASREQSIRLGDWMDWADSYYTHVGREQLHDLGLPQEVLASAAGSTAATTSCPGVRAAATASPRWRSTRGAGRFSTPASTCASRWWTGPASTCSSGRRRPGRCPPTSPPRSIPT